MKCGQEKGKSFSVEQKRTDWDSYFFFKFKNRFYCMICISTFLGVIRVPLNGKEILEI